jgi:hypothetical protein
MILFPSTSHLTLVVPMPLGISFFPPILDKAFPLYSYKEIKFSLLQLVCYEHPKSTTKKPSISPANWVAIKAKFSSKSRVVRVVNPLLRRVVGTVESLLSSSSILLRKTAMFTGTKSLDIQGSALKDTTPSFSSKD